MVCLFCGVGLSLKPDHNLVTHGTTVGMIYCACFNFIPFCQHRPRANTYSFKCGFGGSSPDLIGPFFQLFQPTSETRSYVTEIVNEYLDFYLSCGISISPMKVSISINIF